MKKLAILFALLIIPCSAFGLEMLTDNTLDDITGQDGVSIIADDIQLFLHVDLFAYVDCDGVNLHNGCEGDGAMVAFEDFQMDVININAIVADADSIGFLGGQNPELVSTSCGIELFYDYDSTTPWGTCIDTCVGFNVTTRGLDNLTGWTTNYGGATDGAVFKPQAISIDVTDQLPTGSEAYNYILLGNENAGVFKLQGVVITLPTMEIHIQDIHFAAAMYDINCDTTVINGGYTSDNNRFGEFLIQGVTFSILSGWVEIAPH